MIDEDFINTVSPIMESVASDISRRYRQFGADHEDFYQQCLLWLFEHPSKVLRWFDDQEYSTESSTKLLAKTLRNHCTDYGEDVKAQHLGYSRDDLAYYSRTMVRELLPSFFEDDAWIYPEQGDGERRSNGDPAAGGNWVATLADISQAYARLGDDDQALLAAFHRDGYTNKLMAEVHKVSEQVMSYRHDRAVGRLVKLLGGSRPRPQHDEECDHHWRGRRAMSNAAARAAQSSYYEED